ncbi:hypothetical protein [Viscerimonas tarda]
MIKTNIAREYPAHSAVCTYSDKSLYLADYTEQTKASPIKRGVEIFQAIHPTGIKFFTLQNNVSLLNGFIKFDNTSFTRPDGRALSQCECVVFPKTSDSDSWIFFAELKYSSKKCNNNSNIQKAVKQLYKTRTYYFQRKIFSKTNPCYLLASLPMQAEPFAQTIISPTDLLRLKRKHNVILRLQNHAEIQDGKIISV